MNLENRELFKNVIGFENVKKELINTINWINKSDEYLKDNPNVVFPRGFIFYGGYGCGKTLFMREFAAALDREIFEIKGDNKDGEEELSKVFNTARDCGKKSVIIIDELDLFLGDSPTKIRQLMTQMDGFNNTGDIVIIATTNNIYEIPEALKRPGRFDRKIFISLPNQKDKALLIKQFLSDLKINQNELEKINFDFLSRIMTRVSCVEIKAIINDCYLRFNKQITTENLEQSYYFIDNNTLFEYDKTSSNENLHIACHEVGHTLMMNYYKKYFIFYQATIQKTPNFNGCATLYDVDEDCHDLEKEVAKIDINIAGYIALKILYNYQDTGANRDLLEARRLSRVLVNTLGYKGIRYILRQYEDGTRNENDSFVKRNDLISNRLLRKRIRFVNRYLRKHKKELNKLTNILYNKGYLNINDVMEVVKA